MSTALPITFSMGSNPIDGMYRIVTIISRTNNCPPGHPIPIVSRRTGDIRFRQWDATDRNNAIVDRNRFAGQTDHPFDQVLLRIDRENENDDVTTLGLTGFISKFIDKDVFAVLQGGPHAEAIHTDTGGNSVNSKIQDNSQNQCFENIRTNRFQFAGCSTVGSG